MPHSHSATAMALASARTDSDNHLVQADEPLASLQLRCGGALPGALAVPALAELLRKSRRLGLKLARPFAAQDGQDVIRAWAEISPMADADGGGCSIQLRHWQVTPLPAESGESADEMKRAIDHALAEFTARLDARQNLLSVHNDAADLREMTASMQQAIGQPWTDFVEIAGDSHRQPLHWRLLDGAALRMVGSDRLWRASLQPQMGAGDAPLGFELSLTAETPLMAASFNPSPTAMMGRASAVNERLVGRDVAPALRQPIARIIANAETIRTRLAGPLEEDYARYAADIAAAGEHLLALVDDLSDLEVIEAENFTTTPDIIDLGDVARRAAGILGVRARDKGITIDAPAEGVSQPARAEFRRVLQVLLNLTGNAIHYSPAGSRVQLQLNQANGRAFVRVIDQGPGLSAAQQARIFDKFERLGRSGDGGSGLGLYISRRLAKAMDGQLTVTSTPGHGAMFTLDVPAEKRLKPRF
jgi:signal transduction histidine kinase